MIIVQSRLESGSVKWSGLLTSYSVERGDPISGRRTFHFQCVRLISERAIFVTLRIFSFFSSLFYITRFITLYYLLLLLLERVWRALTLLLGRRRRRSPNLLVICLCGY